jgi:hypothetical protein
VHAVSSAMGMRSIAAMYAQIKCDSDMVFVQKTFIKDCSDEIDCNLRVVCLSFFNRSKICEL